MTGGGAKLCKVIWGGLWDSHAWAVTWKKWGIKPC